jgi:hypothetical protein
MKRDYENISAVPDDALLEMFEHEVCRWHYDPHKPMRPAQFDMDNIREEIARRMAGLQSFGVES